MAFHAAPLSPSSSALSAHHPSRSSQLQLGQLHLHHQPPSRLSFVRTLPLRIRLRIPRFQLSPLPVALPSSTDHNNNDNENGNNNSSGGGGGGGDGEAEHDGGASDGQRGEALFVLSQVGRKLESLPGDLAAAIEGGRVTGEIVRRFAEMESSSPFLRWLLQFRGFRERLLADELFLAKLAMECGVGVIAKTAEEYEKRKENFFKEINAVITDVVMAIFADFMIVYCSAPIVSMQPSPGTLHAIIFQGARPLSFMDKLGKIMRICPKLFVIGISSSQVDTGVTNALVKEWLAYLKVGAELLGGMLNILPILVLLFVWTTPEE